jgi:hypothetical protein
MCVPTTSSSLPAPLLERLSADDDPALWEQVLQTAAQDASLLQVRSSCSKLYAIVGLCSHWAQPHRSRWRAAGGFAVPYGYGDGEGFVWGLPNLDWSVTLELDSSRTGWVHPQQLPTKRFRSVRLAVPSRTTRHRQAAVHAIWSSGTLDAKHQRTVFYGLRKTEQGWKLVARLQKGEGQARGECTTAPPRVSRA